MPASAVFTGILAQLVAEYSRCGFRIDIFLKTYTVVGIKQIFLSDPSLEFTVLRRERE